MGEIDDFVNDNLSSRGTEYGEGVFLPAPDPQSLRKNQLKWKYGLTLDQYDELFTQQGDKCVICGGVNKNGKRLFVDHDHKTGKIRGLLCSQCNTMFGMAGDNPQILANAIEYLKGTE
jgi:hypothetical protein